jgi:hypothetical protein
VAQIPGSGLLVQPFRGFGRSLLPLRSTSASVVLLLATSWTQAQSVPNNDSIQKNAPTTSAASPVTPQQVVPQPVSPPPLPVTSAPQPLQPPTVAWDGKQLTVDANNSSLADILVAVRKRTGASIELPAAASGERVFVHLGPGPVREILSDLLYGTPFDYVIQTAEDDPDALRSVMLTARGQSDDSTGVVVAGATDTGDGIGGQGTTLATDARSRVATDGRTRSERVRMMPGWNSPSKPTFQADAEAALAAAQAAAEDSAAAQDSAPANDSVPAADAAGDTKASNSSPATPDSNNQSGVGQAIQSMTRMFEQRRQIQAQQNQPPPPSSN